MSGFFDAVMRNLSNLNWEGPAMLAIIGLAVLAMFRQWHVLLITLFTIVLGWGAEDLIIMNIETNMEIISVSLLIYCIGGGIGLILAFSSFLKLAL